jgi:hypothetical protein
LRTRYNCILNEILESAFLRESKELKYQEYFQKQILISKIETLSFSKAFVAFFGLPKTALIEKYQISLEWLWVQLFSYVLFVT